MAGLIFGVDLAGLGFEITKLRVAAPQITFNEIPIPGRSGVVRLNPRLGTRQIAAEGVIMAANQTTLMSNLATIETYLFGSLSTEADPTNHVAPTIPVRDLTLPSFGGKKFPNCECESWDLEFLQGRPTQNVCKFNIVFKQTIPFTATA